MNGKRTVIAVLFYVIGFGCQEVLCFIIISKLHKIIARCRLHEMDFLNVPGNKSKRTQPSAIRHPGSVRTFVDIRVHKLLTMSRTLRKSHFTSQ